MVSALIALGIISILAMAWASILNASHLETARLNTNLTAALVRANIQALLENPEAWQSTVDANPTMNCIRLGTSCAGHIGNETEIRILKNAADETVFTSTNPSSGFSNEGSPCSTFHATNGNASCPFRIRIWWQPDCPSAALCSGRPIYVHVELIFRHPQSHPFNVNKFALQVVK